VLIIAVASLLTMIPAYRILRRTDFNGWWCLLFLIPAAGWASLWYFAFTEWPAIDKNSPGPFGRMRPESSAPMQ
jgi:uncharacterized membrane protein YhaH (DUF805 family)